MIGLYLALVGMSIRSLMQRRGSFLLGAMGQLLTYSAEFLLIWLLVDRFHAIGGWSAAEVMLLFALNLTSYGIAGFFFFGSMRILEDHIEKGDLDLVLTKPLPPLFSLIAFNPTPNYVTHLALSVTTLLLSMRHAHLALSLGRLAVLLETLLGATLIHGAVFVVSGVLNFWVRQAGSATWDILRNIREFDKYPLNIYPNFLQTLLTLVLPFGFISFYPALRLLGREPTLFPAYVVRLTLAVGACSFTAACLLWRAGLRRYESTGS